MQWPFPASSDHEHRKRKAGPVVTNPFEQNVPQQAPRQQPANPFGNPPAPTAAGGPASPQNPFGQGVPTQPQSQQQAPQAYTPPANPYANPYGVAPGAQQAPAVYGGPQQAQQQYPAGYPAPQAAPSHPVATGYAPPLGELSAAGVAPSGDGKGAKLANMYGRLVIMFPTSHEMKPKNPRFVTPEDQAAGRVTEERVTTTVVVLDDGRGGMSPITWGGSAMPPVPDTDSAPLPYVRKGMWISQSRIVAQLKPHLPAPGGAPGMVIGRLYKAGNEHNSPWYLSSEVSEADLALGNAYRDLVGQGRYPHPLAP